MSIRRTLNESASAYPALYPGVRGCQFPTPGCLVPNVATQQYSRENEIPTQGSFSGGI